MTSAGVFIVSSRGSFYETMRNPALNRCGLMSNVCRLLVAGMRKLLF